MRSRVLAALLLAATAAVTGACAARTQPYRFATPMLGQADVPDAALPGSPDADRPGRAKQRSSGRNSARTTYAYGWQQDAQSGIRTASAAGIELRQPEASADAAAAITKDGVAKDVIDGGLAWVRLPAPHKVMPSKVVSSAVGATIGAAMGGESPTAPSSRSISEPAALRALTGTRDKRDALEITLAWLDELGLAPPTLPADGVTFVASAASTGKLQDKTSIPAPGDVLVFDRATSDTAADLLGIVIARDSRGVIEFMYASGGVIRRGFVDPARPTIRRDLSGIVVNTFLRHTKKWPPKGTRYLAGELLAHIISSR